MATETFLATALPYSTSPTAPFHVSVFFTHRLTPDGAGARLDEFPATAQWSRSLTAAGTTFRLRGSTGEIAVTPVLDALERPLWRRVFPPDTPVDGFTVPDLIDRPWRTFPAHRMAAHAKLVHLVAAFGSPTVLPPTATDAVTQAMLQLFEISPRMDISDLLDQSRGGELEGPVTRALDALLTGGSASTPGTSSSIVGRLVTPASDDPVMAMLVDVHAARRYYQRPEEELAYRERPLDGAVRPGPARPTPDFHQRAAAIADTPAVLRRLGLVVDLRVDDPAVLVAQNWLQAEVTVEGLAGDVVAQPKVKTQPAGADLVAVPRTADWQSGQLRIGDQTRFRVLDLDPDASALKLEQHLRSTVRRVVAARNGDPVNAAPATLQGTGFAVARLDRAGQLHAHLGATPALDAALSSGRAPELAAEDVTRGVRLEVWDDASGQWHSLHERVLDLSIGKGAPFAIDVADLGFLQGAALSKAPEQNGGAPNPYHAHEVLAGWDGWSLSAPRPGLVVDDAGDPQPEPVLDPVARLVVRSRIGPADLPWLRYGRSYVFRAYAVDLAGNSRPHEFGTEDDDGSEIGPAQVAALAAVHAWRTAQAGAPHRAEHPATAPLRGLIRSVPPGAGPATAVAGVDLADLTFTGHPDLDRAVGQRLAGRVLPPLAQPSRRSRVEALFRVVVDADTTLAVQVDDTVDPRVHAAALVAAFPAAADRPSIIAASDLELVTAPRPFLRWDPVIAPAVVPRHPYSPGESTLRLVIRSGVDVAADGTITVVAPAEYAATVGAAHPTLHLRGTSERHLAPPKTSQLEAELHGRFDDAIGSIDPDVQRAAYGVALREAGTFLDLTVADLANPGQRLPQPGVELHHVPTADPDDLRDLATLERGDGLAAGQYVVHDTDQVVLPYLPDPLADGVSFVFPDAGQDHRLPWPFAIEGVTLPYPNGWPERVPWRLVLGTGPQLGARAFDHAIEVQVPPGERLRMRMSSCLRPDSLELHGLWRSLPPALRDQAVIAEAAADGWFWWLTPYEEVQLVHAVQRPVEVPRTTMLLPIRAIGDTAVRFFGAVDVHGPSTERFDLEATWTEQVDDVGAPVPGEVHQKGVACDTTVDEREDIVVLAPGESTVPLPDGSMLRLHKAEHQLGDTRHRVIDYAVRATTRYREYFPAEVAPTPADLSVLGAPTTVRVPSTARPARPQVRDVLPLFHWSEETEPEQPFALRRRRRPGIRVWLDRPWFSSGDGELLAVVLAVGQPGAANDQVSEWGGDPVWRSTRLASRTVLPLTDLLHATGLDDRLEPGRPVTRPTPLPLVDREGAAGVVLGYAPVFHAGRGLWYVDVRFDPGAAFWPFVRLAVARYQPDSLAGLHLSPVVQTDFVQLVPERIATLSRPDAGHARVVVSGPVGTRNDVGSAVPPPAAAHVTQNRTVRARLEQFDPAVGTDLGWATVASLDLTLLGLDGLVASWTGTLELPDPIPPARPGAAVGWRVTVEEWERLPADPARVGGVLLPRTGSRLVYADHLAL